jgi:rhodanese-related sulfurtransferase
MRPVNFLRILAISIALSGYSAWVMTHRPAEVKLQAYGEVADIPLIRRGVAESLWHEPSTLFVDARSSIDYHFGHIRGAVSIPEKEFEARFPDLKPRLTKAKTIVVYCKNIDCGQSLWTAIRLRNEGLTQTVIYPDGWNDWDLHDLPTVKVER